ncbi:MAG TPA: DciA family protein [Chitinophagales bacterium]|nr:DciA family protein [Chitinophagales bacterium]HNK98213.1 DciA family protein [Chitinophagales bacterium]
MKQDLGFSKQQIIDRVNEELGERVVKEVAIR